MEPLRLKTVELSARLDQFLRIQAFDEHRSNKETTRQYVKIGYELSQGG